jgi:Lectin C-type domain
MARARLLGAGAFILLGVSGCPVTDDYFIERSQPAISGAGTSTDADSTGGSDTLSQAGTAQAGTASAQGGSAQGGLGGSANPTGGKSTAGDAAAPAGGAPDMGQAGDGGAGGAPACEPGGELCNPPCVPGTERCNGHDDDCDDAVDELVCNSNQNGTSACFGFVLADHPQHGYMLCTSKTRNYAQAKQSCAGQDMRLVWLESADENNAVALKVEALTLEADVLIGATDQVTEGYWFWDGGVQFWKGNENGAPVNGSFAAWAQGNAPDNNNTGEDCGVLAPKTGVWNDRSCLANYPFLCEEKN